jgi:acetyl esterase/lipase
MANASDPNRVHWDDTVTTAYRWLSAGGTPRVAGAGDACGARLALTLALRARDTELTLRLRCC